MGSLGWIEGVVEVEVGTVRVCSWVLFPFLVRRRILIAPGGSALGAELPDDEEEEDDDEDDKDDEEDEELEEETVPGREGN